jgi:hypothetical protein
MSKGHLYRMNKIYVTEQIFLRKMLSYSIFYVPLPQYLLKKIEL